MRRRSFDRILTTWFFFLLVVIIASTWLSFKSLERIVANDRRVDFSRSVIDELEATLSTLKDAEAGQRGFIITGEESYLDPYDASISRIAEHETRSFDRNSETRTCLCVPAETQNPGAAAGRIERRISQRTLR